MMPPPLHLSDIRCKCFPYILAFPRQANHAAEARNERADELMCLCRLSKDTV